VHVLRGSRFGRLRRRGRTQQFAGHESDAGVVAIGVSVFEPISGAQRND